MSTSETSGLVTDMAGLRELAGQHAAVSPPGFADALRAAPTSDLLASDQSEGPSAPPPTKAMAEIMTNSGRIAPVNRRSRGVCE